MAARNIDRELQEMALTRWDEFKKLFDIDPTQLVICIERKNGQSIRQIANKTRLHKDKVHRMCGVCP